MSDDEFMRNKQFATFGGISIVLAGMFVSMSRTKYLPKKQTVLHKPTKQGWKFPSSMAL